MSGKGAIKYEFTSAESIFRSGSLVSLLLSFSLASCEYGFTISRPAALTNKAMRELRETVPEELAFTEGSLTRQTTLTATWSLENGTNIVSTEIRLFRDATCTTLLYSKPLTAGARTTSFSAYTEGPYSFFVANKLKDGRSASSSCSAPIRVDFTPPMVPSALALKAPLTSPNTLASTIITVSGVSSGDLVTLYSQPTCASPSALTSTRASGPSIDLLVDFIADGTYPLYATSTDPAGNTSNCSTASLTYVLDRVAPGTPIGITLKTPLTSPGNTTAATFTVSGVSPGDRVSLHSSSNCSSSSLIGSGTAFGSNIDLTAIFPADGAYSVYAKSSDAASNASACSSASAGYTLDRVAPIAPTGISLKTPTSAFSTSPNATFTVSGSNPGDLVFLYTSSDCAGGSLLTSGFATGSSIDLSVSFLVEGAYSVYSKASDAAGNISSCSTASANFVYDRGVPNPPSAIALRSPVTSPGNLAAVPFVVSGVSAGDTVALYSMPGCELPSLLASGTATNTSINLTANFTVDGTHSVYARATDRAGNVSTCSTATRSYTLDRVAPGVPVGIMLKAPAASPGNLASATFTVTGVSPGDTIGLFSAPNCSANSTITSSTASGSAIDLTTPYTMDGTHTVYARATDSAGNASACSTANAIYTLDRVAPAMPAGIQLKTPDSTPSNLSTVTFTVSGVTPGDNIALYNASNCNAGSLLVSGNATASNLDLTANISVDGTYAVYARATDPAGNVSACSTATAIYTLDRVGPAVPDSVSLKAPAASPSTAPSGTFTVAGVSSGDTIALFSASDCNAGSLLASGPASGASIDLGATFPADGTYTIYTKATDAAGNASACSTATASYTLDRVAPAIPNGIVRKTPATSPATATSVTFTVSGVGSGDTVALYSTANCLSPSLLSSGVAATSSLDLTATFSVDGFYSVYARSSDAAGNVSACSTVTENYVLDRSASPAPGGIALKTPATSPANTASPVFTVSGVVSGDTIKLFSNSTCTTQVGSVVATGTSTDVTATLSTDGVYTLYANATNSLGNASTCSSASASYTLDRVASGAPSGIVLKTPSTSPGNNASPVLTVSGVVSGDVIKVFSDSSCTTQVGSATSTGATVDVTATLSTDGAYTLYANSTDPAGNASDCSTVNRAYTLDRVAPAAPSALALKTPTASPGRIATPVLTVSGVVSGDTIKLYSNSGCTTQVGSATSTGTTVDVTATLSVDGVYTLYANATDSAGNISTCSTANRAYTLDRVAPNAPSGITLKTPASSPNSAYSVIFTVAGVSSGDSVAVYSSSACTSPSLLGAGTAAGTTLDVTANFASSGSYVVYAATTDPAGNTSACSTASAAYQVLNSNMNYVSSIPAVNNASGFQLTTNFLETELGYYMNPIEPFNDGSGTYPTSFTLSGTLPAGLSFNSTTGSISGRPSSVELRTVTICNTADSSKCQSVEISVVGEPVISGPLSVSPALCSSTSGTGTNADPIVLSSVNDLDTCVRNYPSRAFKLGNDIDFGGTAFTRITNFNGIFDGQGRTLRNGSTSATHGIFENVNEGSVIKNLTFQNFRVRTCGVLGCNVRGSSIHHIVLDQIVGTSTTGLLSLMVNVAEKPTTIPSYQGHYDNIEVKNSSLSITSAGWSWAGAVVSVVVYTPTRISNVKLHGSNTFTGTNAMGLVTAANQTINWGGATITNGNLWMDQIEVLSGNTATLGALYGSLMAAPQRGDVISNSYSRAALTGNPVGTPGGGLIGGILGGPLTGPLRIVNSYFGGTLAGQTAGSIAGSNYYSGTLSLIDTASLNYSLPAAGNITTVTNRHTNLTDAQFNAPATAAFSTWRSNWRFESGSYPSIGVVPGAPTSITLNTPAASPGNSATPIFTVGGVTSGTTIRIFSDACTTQIGEIVATGTSANVTAAFPSDGAYTVYANATDSFGRSSPCTTATASYTLDRVAPGTPSGITLKTPSATPGTATTVTWTISGVASGDVIALYSTSNCSSPSFITSGTASGTSIDLSTTYSVDGTYPVYALSSDLAGNASACSSATASYALDRAAPTAPAVTITNGSPTNSQTLNLSYGATPEAGTNYCLRENNTSSTGCSFAALPLPSTFGAATANGAVALTLFLRDAAGNISTASTSGSITIDTTAPGAPSAIALNTPSTSPGNNASPVLTVSGVASGDTVRLFPDSSCSTQLGSAVASASTVDVTATLPSDGAYSLYSNSTDPVGNTSTCSTATASYTLDRVAPSAPSGIALKTPASSPNTATAATYTVSGVTSGDTIALYSASNCASPSFITSSAASGTTLDLSTSYSVDGTYGVYTLASDAAGNTSPCSTATANYTLNRVTPSLNYAGATGSSGTFGQAMSVSPTTLNQGGYAITACGIKSGTTALPAWASVNATTCVITGTPNATLNATNYTLVATNTAGNSADASATLNVAAAAPTLSFAGATGTNGALGQVLSVAPTSLQGNGAAITACGIKSGTTALPAWASVNATTCVITGTPNTTLSATAYTLVATNSVGTSADAVVTLSATTALLLDGTNAHAAFSIARKLRTSYSGSAIRIRRSADNTEQDIGFTAEGVLDTAAISAFVSTQSAFITKVYDQTGNGRHREVTTAAQQPRIVNAGTLETQGSRPAAHFYANQSTLWGVGILPGSTAYSLYLVYRADNQKAVMYSAGTNQFAYAGEPGSTSSPHSQWNEVNSYKNGSQVPLSTRNAMSTSMNISSQVLHSIMNATPDPTWNNDFHFGGYFNIVSDYAWRGYYQEEVIYPGNDSASRASRESNISEFYSIQGITPAIASGQQFACALLSNGTVKCWGSGENGQLGNNNFQNSSTPVSVTGLSGVKALANGNSNFHMCGILLDGSVKCWGANWDGQLGNGTTIDSPTPVTVTGLGNVKEVVVGVSFTCALLNDGSVKCWGAGYNLGDGVGNHSTTPVSVSGLNGGAIAIAAGQSHACALLSNGTVKCWGENFYAVLGNSTLYDGEVALIPVTVSGLSGATAISAGFDHSCALLSDGSVKCWGGAVEIGSSDPTPRLISGLTGVTALAKSDSCALLADGTVKCWNVPGGTPETITGFASGVSAIAVGAESSCALLSNHTVQCWGAGSLGQIGNNSFQPATNPTSVHSSSTDSSQLSLF